MRNCCNRNMVLASPNESFGGKARHTSKDSCGRDAVRQTDFYAGRFRDAVADERGCVNVTFADFFVPWTATCFDFCYACYKWRSTGLLGRR